MKLKDVIERLADWVNIKVYAVSEYGNIIVAEDANHINDDYLDCDVEIIDITENVLIVTIDDLGE